MNFQTDGGDKHPSPDRIENGEFTASRFRLRFDIAGLKSEPKLENGRFAIDLGGAKLYLEIRKAAMSTFEPNVTWGREGNVFAISLDWFAPGEPRKIRWADTGPACAIFTMAMSGPNNPSKNSLALGGRLVPAPLSEQDRAFNAEIDGKPVPQPRLGDARLASCVLQ